MEYQLKEVVAELTELCNASCLHCGSACTAKSSDQELSIKEWQSVIDQLIELGAKKIVFSGGEPTIKPKLEDLISYLANKKIKFGIISNGWRIKKSLIKLLAEIKPFAVGISLDGLIENHNFIRNNNQSWDKAINSISGLMADKIPICIVTTVNQLNCRELIPLGQLIAAAGIKVWQLQLAKPTGRMNDHKNLLIDEGQFKAVCLDIIKMKKMFPKLQIDAADCFGPAPKNIIRSIDWFGCTAGFSSLGIDAFGNVMPCLALRNGGQHGNVRGKPISEIWRNPENFSFNRNFSTKNVIGQCQDCRYLENCGGGCASISMAYYGHLHDAPFCFYRSFGMSNLNQKERR